MWLDKGGEAPSEGWHRRHEPQLRRMSRRLWSRWRSQKRTPEHGDSDRRVRPRGRFLSALARPLLDPDNVLDEVAGRMECGPVGAAPLCWGDDGVLALLVDGRLGWVVPSQLDCVGFIESAWIAVWSLEEGELTIQYQPPPVPVHFRDPFRVELRHEGPKLLRLTTEPAELAAFVARAHRVLGEVG